MAGLDIKSRLVSTSIHYFPHNKLCLRSTVLRIGNVYSSCFSFKQLLNNFYDVCFYVYKNIIQEKLSLQSSSYGIFNIDVTPMPKTCNLQRPDLIMKKTTQILSCCFTFHHVLEKLFKGLEAC